jgi:hypothetical protein
MPRRATAHDFAAWPEVNSDTRAHLWLTCSLLVDELRSELDAADADSPPWEVDMAPFGFSEILPRAMRGRYDNSTTLAFLHALDAVIWKLGNQPGQMLSCTMEELALRAILKRAELLVEELNEVEERGERPWWGTGLDTEAVDLAQLYDLAFQDLDHEMLFMPHLDGIEGDERVLSSLGIGDELKPENWLTPFDSATDRGHPLTWLESTS